MHGRFWKGKNGALTSAVVWSLCGVLWLSQCAVRFQSEDQGLMMLTLFVAVLSLINSVVWWRRYLTLRRK